MKNGFKDFLIVKEKTTGDVVITKNTQYNNIEADSVIIEENATARLYGDIRNLLVLKKGSKLYMHGRIHGNVENYGGELNTYSK